MRRSGGMGVEVCETGFDEWLAFNEVGCSSVVVLECRVLGSNHPECMVVFFIVLGRLVQ